MGFIDVYLCACCRDYPRTVLSLEQGLTDPVCWGWICLHAVTCDNATSEAFHKASITCRASGIAVNVDVSFQWFRSSHQERVPDENHRFAVDKHTGTLTVILVGEWLSAYIHMRRLISGGSRNYNNNNDNNNWGSRLVGLSSHRTIEAGKPRSCFRGSPWLCKGETRSHS